MGKMGKALLFLFAFIPSSYCNSLPVINMAMVQVSEDIEIDEFAFQIDAYDVDNDTLTYKIQGQNAYYFKANKQTGEVTIGTKLDRETNDLFHIEVVVNDGVYADVTKTVYIAVLDANDNKPLFENLPYNRDIPENTPVGTTIFTATATDIDSGRAAIVSYKIDEVVPNDGLQLFEISETNGNVVLKGPLNFNEKSPFYQIKVNATDGGGPLNSVETVQSSTTIALIAVKDVPDIDPQFLNLPNYVTIDENSPKGTLVFTVRARDPDTGINDPIDYSIESPNAQDLFQIEESDGKITVKTAFDREALLDISAVVELNIKASETNPNVNGVIASTVQTLQISITDVNDNGPNFYECEGDICTQKNSFTGVVDEHSSVGVAVARLNIRVKDPDQGENSTFELKLDGPDKDAFSVTPSSGLADSIVQVMIKNSEAVDFEKKKTLTVQIIAKDANADFTSTASVTININDVNDNYPEFEKENYEFSIDEHCKDGTIIATITATDEDALDDGKITYKLVPSSMLKYFDVFPNNGTIYVKDGKLLDREITSSYTPTLQAIDSEGKTGTTVVEINLRDINDQTPVMNREKYETFVQENDNLEIEIQARDGDEPETPNSKIQYHIKDGSFSSNFTIDLDSGVLLNKGLLDREAIDPKLKGVIELTVIASDMGMPSLSSSATVIINIADVNDNSPKYLNDDYIFHVKENEGGILVGSVLAHDADQTELYNRITFSIENTFGRFLIISEPSDEGYQGNIKVDPVLVLDYESEFKTYTLTIEASDLGQNKAVTTVQVVVEDVNDTPPEFPADLMLRVKENTTVSAPLGAIVGTDVDTKHFLEYALVSAECQCGGIRKSCPDEWFKVETNGDVVVNYASASAIDYEKCDQAFLTAKVVDIKTEKGPDSTEGIVTITIEDINDNAPEFFTVQDFYVVLLERVDKGSAVGKVYAEDRDTGENKKTKFTVLKVEFISSEGNVPQDLIFYADTEAQQDAEGKFSTDIRSQKKMDTAQKGKFILEVEACNPDGLCSTSVLELLTVDSSYKVSLRFKSPVSVVNENLPRIREILTSATKASVHIFNVILEEKTQRAAEDVTVLEAYFVFPNGSALDYADVNRILNSEEVYMEYGIVLVQLGFTGISTTTDGGTKMKTEVFIMIGVVAALGIIAIVTTTSLVCIRRNYKRKLKASKAMNSAATVVIENQKSGPVVPGTNKYTSDGANPVLNMNFNTVADLGFDEDGSSIDKESLNSLDYNIDMNMTENDSMPMMMIEEEDEEDDRSASPYIEPLGAALAQREKKRENESPNFAFDNPAMSTTDL